MKNASQVIDDNFYQHCWKITSQIPGMQVFFTDSLSLSDCGLSCDTFNIIYIRHTDSLTVEELIHAKKYFELKNIAYTVWAGENQLTPPAQHLLKNASLTLTNREPGMLLPLHSYSPARKDAYQAIRKAVTPEEVGHYARIVAQNWQPADQQLIEYYSRATAEILKPSSPASLYVYYISGEPVAAGELFISEADTAGIFGLSTLQAYRGQGIGSALFTYLLQEAQKQGCKYAVLQASEDGIGIYKKQGFRIETYFSEFH